MKVGLFGGTFDPPHIGHLVIADQALTALKLDTVWFVPVGQPTHKDAAQVSLAASSRGHDPAGHRHPPAIPDL